MSHIYIYAKNHSIVQQADYDYLATINNQMLNVIKCRKGD